jgi:hypothetical protein
VTVALSHAGMIPRIETEQQAQMRKRFVAYLTSGDVLAAMLADVEQRQPNATRILTAFLERELRADESARLD